MTLNCLFIKYNKNVKAILCVLLITFAFPILSVAASAAASDSFRFIAWADTKTGTPILTNESRIANGLNPVFTIYPGDLCDSGPDAACFATWKNALNGGGTNSLFNKTFATRGNHDSSGGTYWQTAFEFAATATRVGATNYTAQTQDMTFSFDYGNSHFVGIDIPGGNVNTMSLEQINWLDNDLTAAEGRSLTNVFLFWHGPIYYVDGHPSTSPAALITALNKHPIVAAGFYGHEHLVTYTHIDSSRIPSVTQPFEEFISGAAGAELYNATAGRYDYWLNNEGSSKSGFMAVDVSGNNFNVSVYNVDGSIDKTLLFSNEGGNAISTPAFSPPAGTYSGARSVTISTATAGTTIHYTLDGTDPTESSITYTGPLTIYSTTTIKAKAWKTGMNPSSIATGVYTIYTPVLKSITVTFPNGGEIWARGTTHTIKWNSAGTPEPNVKIELMKNGALVRTIDSSTPNDGYRYWTIPSTQTLGTDYKIRIKSTSNPEYNDTSNNNFTIGGINVNSPNGGEIWARGTTHTIKWNSAGTPEPNVKIELLKNGALVRTIDSSTPNDGYRYWTIPSTQTLGTDYKIRITSTSNPEYNDTSNNNFTIGGINVNSPNGGEIWARGTTHTIKWNSAGTPEPNVKIELMKNGALVRTIVSSTPNDGYRYWTISSTQTLGTDYKIKITSTGNPENNDTSNNNFTIGGINSPPIALGSGYPTNAYKGNTHTHSNDSVDAPTRTPEHTINHYAGMGYSFLALTEHNNSNTTLNQYNNASFIVLEAEENSATTDGGQHINVFNITHITSSTTFTKQQLINNVTSSGGLVFLNHPNWGGDHYTLAQMLTLQNYTGIEIYGVGGNAIAKWDSLLMTGRHIFGSSVDDSHDDSRDGFRWINVFASSLTNNTIISAIRDGKFYSVRGDYKNGSMIDMNIHPFEINNYSMGSTLNFIYGNVTSNVTINSTETIDTIQLIRINSTDSRVIASKINCAATLCNWVYSLTPTDTQENSTYRLYAKTKKTELWSNPIWLNRGYGLTP